MIAKKTGYEFELDIREVKTKNKLLKQNQGFKIIAPTKLRSV